MSRATLHGENQDILHAGVLEGYLQGCGPLRIAFPTHTPGALAVLAPLVTIIIAPLFLCGCIVGCKPSVIGGAGLGQSRVNDAVGSHFWSLCWCVLAMFLFRGIGDWSVCQRVLTQRMVF